MNDFRAYQSNALYHHGVEGMHWGQRNGPPYPLQTFQRKAGNAVAKGKRALADATTATGKALVKVYKNQAEKAKAKRAEERARKQAEAADLERRKADAARRAKLMAIAKKHPEYLTNQELMDLNNRARQEASYKDNYLSTSKKKGESTVSQAKSGLLSDVIKPGVVAIGKSAVMATIGGGKFKEIASVELDKAYNGKSKSSGDGDKEKKSEKKRFAGFEFKVKRE